MGLYNPFNMLNKKIKKLSLPFTRLWLRPDYVHLKMEYLYMDVSKWFLDLLLAIFVEWLRHKNPGLGLLCVHWRVLWSEAPTFSLKGATELLNRGLWLYALSETFYVETFLMKCVNCEQNILAVCMYSMPQTWYETRTAFNVQTGN